MPDDATRLRNAAKRAILTGALRREQWVHLWGQPGDDTACAVCGEGLRPDQLTLGVQFTHNRPEASGALYVHLPCFVAWDQERQQLDPT